MPVSYKLACTTDERHTGGARPSSTHLRRRRCAGAEKPRDARCDPLIRGMKDDVILLAGCVLNCGQSLPRILTGFVYNYSMGTCLYPRNDCPQFGKL